MALIKVDVKAAALHAFALVLGPPKTSASPPAAVVNSAATTAVTGGSSGHNNNDDGDGDEVMGNTAVAAAAAATEEGRGRERSLLCRLMFERLGMCNNPQPAGALLLDLARQPVPEVHPILITVRRMTYFFGVFVLLLLLLLHQPQWLAFLATQRKELEIVGSTAPLYTRYIYIYIHIPMTRKGPAVRLAGVGLNDLCGTYVTLFDDVVCRLHIQTTNQLPFLKSTKHFVPHAPPRPAPPALSLCLNQIQN